MKSQRLLFSTISSMHYFSRDHIFDTCFRLLILILPFITILSVFTSQILHLPWMTYVKELLLVVMWVYLFLEHFSGRSRIRWSFIDVLLAWYIGILIFITLFTTGFTGLLYGWRYDFEFLIAFFIIFHGSRFLKESSAYYVRLFLISGWIMLFFSLLVRFVFSPDILLYFWFSGNPSNWQFGVTPPIFHGVDGANVQRFQGILDGPNSMGAFLILYSGMLAYYTRQKRDWHFVVGGVLLLLLGLVFLTYGRAALIGWIGWALIIFLSAFRFLYGRHKKELLIVWVIAFLVLAFFALQYRDKAEALLAREGSSKWHLSRMITGLERFADAPLGQWLWSSWPWYRYVLAHEWANEEAIRYLEPQYIPESWYIQQLVEGGIFWFLFFSLIFLLLAYCLFSESVILFAIFFGVCTMNLVLHTFEVTYVSLILFGLFAVILGKKREKYPHAGICNLPIPSEKR